MQASEMGPARLKCEYRTDPIGIEERSPKMNSLNHYSLGSVGEWLYRYVAGIDLNPEGAGYERILIRPRPGGGPTHARVGYDSIRGLTSSGWEISDGELRLRVKVPANATAGEYEFAGD